MKNLFRASVFVVLYLLLSACGGITPVPALPVTSTPTLPPLPSLTAITVTPLPSPTATVPLDVRPTLIPTIDPTLVPGLLKNAFSVQTFEGVNGHTLRQITGWKYGYGGGFMENSCAGYDWLDTSHLLLYPTAGQVSGPWGTGWSGTKVVPQPVVMNVENGSVWLPPVSGLSPEGCERVYWSRELKILITSEMQEGLSTVSTYTVDGRRLASYPGSLVSVSPSKTKILVDDDQLIDLRTGKKTILAWSLEDYQEGMLSAPFWTTDETRIYRCCYFYADLGTGVSHRFEMSDFRDSDGNHLDPYTLWFYRGGWVQDDTYFLVTWSYIDDGDIRYLPMFDPAKKKYYDVRKMAGIPDDWTAFQYDVPWDGKYVWLMGGVGSYLIDLSTFEARYYPDLSSVDTDWSPNSKFVFLYLDEGVNRTHRYSEYSILSIADNEIRPLPVKPVNDWLHWWHANNNILIYPSEDQSNLIFLDMSTMSFRKLPWTFQEKYMYGAVAWSPDGEKIALVAQDGSIWLIDYPGLENLEQITPVLPSVGGVDWLPDGSSIAFISGSDIYIVDTK